MNKVQLVESILVVPSIEDTAAWYERVLGWKGHFDVFDPDGKCNFGSVNGNPDGFTGLNLIRAAPGTDPERCEHVIALIHVTDLEALYRRVVESGWSTDTPPTEQFWGGRTFTMHDLNGFHLTLAQTVKQVGENELQGKYEQSR